MGGAPQSRALCISLKCVQVLERFFFVNSVSTAGGLSARSGDARSTDNLLERLHFGESAMEKPHIGQQRCEPI